ncbi:MAG: DUF1232 domain-containing protein [Chloroflexi bacterium]|nr:DUF1232 domain-containing protein [Chloroflexota bacterium]
MARPTSLGNVISFVVQLTRDARLAWRLMRDDRVPGIVKIIPPLALVYLVLPFDLMPDFVPLLGQVDDLAIVLLGLRLFIYLCPKQVKQEHLAGFGRTTVR